jgi:hypothetical protein
VLAPIPAPAERSEPGLLRLRKQFNDSFSRRTDSLWVLQGLVEEAQKELNLSQQEHRARASRQRAWALGRCTSSLMEREWRMIVNGNVEAFERRVTDARPVPVAYREFGQLTGRQVFALMASRPQVLEQFTRIYSSSCSALARTFSRYKHILHGL